MSDSVGMSITVVVRGPSVLTNAGSERLARHFLWPRGDLDPIRWLAINAMSKLMGD